MMYAVIDQKTTVLVHYDEEGRNFIVEDLLSRKKVEMHHSLFEGDCFKYDCDFKHKFFSNFTGKTDCIFTKEGEEAYITLMNANREGIYTPYE